MKSIKFVLLLLIIPVFLLVFQFINVKTVSAEVSCPSSEMMCSEIDINGGCASPCVKTITYSGRPRARCVCELPATPGSKACGESCGRPEDCGSACPYCWATNGPPTCQALVNPYAEGLPPGSPEVCAGGSGIQTAIGCIEILSGDFSPIATFLLRWGMGIGGGIAFMLIVYGGFLVMTSAGNPQRLTAGKELLTAAIMGLLMLVFSAFVLRFLGQDILHLDLIGF